jgi:hypothetical protein
MNKEKLYAIIAKAQGEIAEAEKKILYANAKIDVVNEMLLEEANEVHEVCEGVTIACDTVSI